MDSASPLALILTGQPELNDRMKLRALRAIDQRINVRFHLMAGFYVLMCREKSEHLIMHHVKRLKDLSEIFPSEKLMMEKRRKSLALCEDCFKKVQAKLL